MSLRSLITVIVKFLNLPKAKQWTFCKTEPDIEKDWNLSFCLKEKINFFSHYHSSSHSIEVF